MSELGERAVVLGASMGGLLAARVLSDFYRTVTMVERDVLTDDPMNRRGVPQGRHAHVLLARSSQILGELFPGFLDELVAAGVSVWNDGDRSKLCVGFAGHQLVRCGTVPDPKSMALYFPSRPFLGGSLRRRLRAIPNVTILDGHDVVALTSTPVEGPRPLSIRITNAYLGRVMTAAETDPIVSDQFLRITGMIDPPSCLLRPAVIFRVLRANRRRRRPDQHRPTELAAAVGVAFGSR